MTNLYKNDNKYRVIKNSFYRKDHISLEINIIKNHQTRQMPKNCIIEI